MGEKKEIKSIRLDDLAKWLEKNRQGFYLGCRIDPHSHQVNEFVAGLHYYIEKDFGYITKQREKQILRNQTYNQRCNSDVE